MLKSQAVAQYLPFLRRYARALTGNQTSGDAYVGATLEALIEDPKVIDETGGPRVALYRLFTKIWSSVGLNAEGSPVTDDMPADARLASLTPKPRQAFLLVALEGFSEDDAAKVLDVDVADLALAGRGVRPRTRGRDRDRRAHHRGRDLHRDGPGSAGRKPRPSRARRRAHPQGSARARPEEDARA